MERPRGVGSGNGEVGTRTRAIRSSRRCDSGSWAMSGANFWTRSACLPSILTQHLQGGVVGGLRQSTARQADGEQVDDLLRPLLVVGWGRFRRLGRLGLAGLGERGWYGVPLPVVRDKKSKIAGDVLGVAATAGSSRCCRCSPSRTRGTRLVWRGRTGPAPCARGSLRPGWR